MTTTEARCPYAITFGVTMTTRCDRPPHHDPHHEGPGLEECPGQRVSWLAGDRREFTTSRNDRYTW